jgi:hypothetical protein
VDVTRAVRLLQGLVGAPDVVVENQAEAQWLIQANLGTLALARLGMANPVVRGMLQADGYTAVAENAIRQQAFTHLACKLHEAGLPVVPLKGMALGLTVYANPSQRVMSDIDLWLDDAGMSKAAELLPQWGFVFSDKDDRPHELQKLADGEMRFVHPQWPKLLIELHWSPFPGWWLKRTAVVDNTAVWQRLTPHQLPHLPFPLQLLAPEDCILLLILHLAVSSQFAHSPVRMLVDMALLAQTFVVDWDVLVSRAQAWRVATAVWLTLHLALQLLPPRGLTSAHLAAIAPSPLRQWELNRFVTVEGLIHGRDITTSWQRYLLLTLLVDRPQEQAKLIGRTLWPEAEWLHARYGQPTSNWQHLRHLITQRDL